MKSLFLWGALMQCGVLSFAQSVDPGVMPLNIDTERRRIQSSQGGGELRYRQEEAACYARFAVTDCLSEVRGRQRESLAELRRQDLLLNELVRKRKALDQIQRIQDKSSAQRLEEDATLRQGERQVPHVREEQPSPRAEPVLRATFDPEPTGHEQKSVMPRPRAQELAKRQQQYQAKLDEAQARRANREKSNRLKAATRANALPKMP